MKAKDKEDWQGYEDFEKIIRLSMHEKRRLIERVLQLEEFSRKLMMANSQLEFMLRKSLLDPESNI